MGRESSSGPELPRDRRDCPAGGILGDVSQALPAGFAGCAA